MSDTFLRVTDTFHLSMHAQCEACDDRTKEAA